MGLAIVYPPTFSPNIQIGGGGSRDSGNRAPDSPGAKIFSSTYLFIWVSEKKGFDNCFDHYRLLRRGMPEWTDIYRSVSNTRGGF